MPNDRHIRYPSTWLVTYRLSFGLFSSVDISLTLAVAVFLRAAKLVGALDTSGLPSESQCQ
jgi:hypothetical protein